MSPRRPRRRARRRSPARPIVVLGAVAVLAALLIGGLAEVSRQSQGYDATSNRTLAAQGTVVAKQSNATATSVTRADERRSSPRTGRGSRSPSTTWSSRRPTRPPAPGRRRGPTPLGTVGADFAAVFADRARSMVDLRAGDRRLSRHAAPSGRRRGDDRRLEPPAPARAPRCCRRRRPRTASPPRARSWRTPTRCTGRCATRCAPPRETAGCPRRRGCSDPQLWAAGAVASQIDLMASSPSLAVVHYLALRTVQVSPPSLPTPQGGPANVSVLTPTNQISVDVVLANDGSVAEPHATVHYTVADQSSGATSSRTHTVALAPGASQALPTARFGVVAGTTYVLTVSVDVPAGADPAGRHGRAVRAGDLAGDVLGPEGCGVDQLRTAVIGSDSHRNQELEGQLVAESITITDNRTGESIEIPHRVNGGVSAARVGQAPARHLVLRPRVHVDGRVRERHHLPRRRRRASCATAATRSSSWPRSRPTSRWPTCCSTASCPPTDAVRRVAPRDHLPHLHPRERAQAVPRGLPLRRPPHGHAGLGGRRPVDLLPRRQGHLRPRVPRQADHPADRQDADPGRRRPPLQRRHAVRLPRQLARLRRQLPVDDVEGRPSPASRPTRSWPGPSTCCSSSTPTTSRTARPPPCGSSARRTPTPTRPPPPPRPPSTGPATAGPTRP